MPNKNAPPVLKVRKPREVARVLAMIGLGVGLSACGAAPDQAESSTPSGRPPPLPAPVANNGVAAVETPDGLSLFSFLGIDSTRAWHGVGTSVYRWDSGDAAWRELDPPAGPGRLAPTAQVVDGRVFLFGGYTLAEDGSESSVPGVDILDPVTETWGSGAPMPTPVDDAVSGVWRDSLIFLVSGWHDTDNVAAVQIYDPFEDRWTQATPIPGPPVFGHTGGLVDDVLVYVDGARVDQDPRRFALESSSWVGRIQPEDPTQIEWTRMEPHPGPPLYRAAAGTIGSRIYFMGGSDNIYNYSGIGYDGRPSEPVVGAFAYDAGSGGWVEAPPLAVPTMDHRGIAIAGGRAFVIGGMVAGQTVTDRVAELDLP